MENNGQETIITHLLTLSYSAGGTMWRPLEQDNSVLLNMANKQNHESGHTGTLVLAV